MKKLLALIPLASLLTACHVIPINQTTKTTTTATETVAPPPTQSSTPAVNKPTVMPADAKLLATFKAQDEAFEKIPVAEQNITFNNEKYKKKTAQQDKQAYSVYMNEDSNNRKSLFSKTYFSEDANKVQSMFIYEYLSKQRNFCEAKKYTVEDLTYFACDGENQAQRFIAITSLNGDAVSIRSYKSYQEKPSIEQELQIVRALFQLPIDK